MHSDPVASAEAWKKPSCVIGLQKFSLRSRGANIQMGHSLRDSKGMRCGAVWMAKAAGVTMSWLDDCGAV